MVPQESPLVDLANQGAKAVGPIVVVEPSIRNPQGESLCWLPVGQSGEACPK
jgi:hypothetical protein